MATITANTGSNNCLVEGCDKARHGRGWCSTHYRRWRKHGDPLVASAPRGRTLSCPKCDSVFISVNPRRLFCSRSCAVAAANDRRETIAAYPSVCAHCGDKYVNGSYQSLYCSRICKGRAADFRKRLKNQGLTSEQYIEMLDSQGHRCGICQSPDWGGKAGVPNIDHDHATGRVRGLLCNPCNLGIGLLGDSPSTIAAAAVWVGGS